MCAAGTQAGMLLSAPPDAPRQTEFEDREHWLTSTVDAIVVRPRSPRPIVAEVKNVVRGRDGRDESPARVARMRIMCANSSARSGWRTSRVSGRSSVASTVARWRSRSITATARRDGVPDPWRRQVS